MTDLFKARINSNLLKYNLSTNKAYFIVFSVLLFASTPLLVIIDFISKMHEVDAVTVDAKVPYGVVILGILLVLVTPFIIFNYLNSKKSVDVFHALPIKRKDLLLTQLSTSFILAYIPFLLNYIITLILYNAFKYNIPAKLYMDILPLSVLLFSVHLIPVFVMNNTGTTSDGLIHTIIAISLPFAAYGAVLFFATNYIFGVSMFKWDNLKYFSPIYAIFKNAELTAIDLVNVLYWIVFNVLGLSVINKLYNERKSEKSESPFTNNIYFPVVINIFIPIIFLFANVLALPYNSVPNLKNFFTVESFILPLLICFVVYIVLNIFRYRSTKFFTKSSIDFIKVMLVTTLISTTIITTDGFGYAWKVPKAKDIYSVKFQPSDLYAINPIFLNQFDSYLTYELVVELKDEDTIERFTQIHKDINQNFKKNQNKQDKLIENAFYAKQLPYIPDNVYEFNFTYKLKSGQEIRKSLDLPYAVLMDFAQIITQRDYLTVTNPILNSDIKTKDLSIFNNMKSEGVKVQTSEIIDELRSAYLEDMTKMGPDTYLFKPSKLKYIIEYSSDFRSFKQETQGVNFNSYSYAEDSVSYLFIDDRFENTISLLNKYDLEPVEKKPQYNRYQTRDMDYTFFSNNMIENTTMGVISFDRYVDSYAIDYESMDVDTSIQNALLGTHLRAQKFDILQIDNIFIPIEYGVE